MSSLPISQAATVALQWRMTDPFKWTMLCHRLSKRFPAITEMQIIAKLDMLSFMPQPRSTNGR